ncbi:MAG: DNA topoisomerase 3 [Porphyromonas sp.]|nr:DNA topoisomerase 3 [Porphyromonas sp.]
MILCIAEKPSAARDIAAVLGATQKHNGYLEGQGYCVTWTFGHLCTLKEPHDYKPEWQRWSLDQLPMIPEKFGIKLIEDRGIEPQFNIIKHLVSQASEVINCGDAGQEGELIQRWVLQLAECKVPVKRLWLSSMTEEAIREAFNNLKPDSHYQNLYMAGLSRAVGDWILGLNATRLYTQQFKPSHEKGILSVGRVQTPTLALLVERQLEIEQFVPKPYWEIKTTYRDTIFNSTKGKYEDASEAQKVLEQILSEPLCVTKVEKKAAKEGPPRLFDLTSLQIECNKKWGLTADETLRCAQALYEKRLLTYPRVDTTYLTDDIFAKCPNVLLNLSASPVLKDAIAPLLGKALKKNKKFVDNSKVTDHHAIIPTGELPRLLSENEERVYHLVAKRFVSSFYPDAEIQNTTISAEVASIPFRATGKEITSPGWRAVFADASNDKEEPAKDDEEARILPVFTKGESGPHKPDLQEKQTQPPKPYTEATLLNAMETAGKLVDDEELKEAMKQKGIGRPSTRSAIIETIQKRGYVEKKRKNLVPTAKGIALIRVIKNDLLKSVRLTGEWEYKLQLIDKGEYSPYTFMEEMKTLVKELVQEVLYGSIPSPIAPVENASRMADTLVVCPVCLSGTLLKGKSAYGCSRFREGCSFRIGYDSLSPTATIEEIQEAVSKLSNA